MGKEGGSEQESREVMASRQADRQGERMTKWQRRTLVAAKGL